MSRPNTSTPASIHMHIHIYMYMYIYIYIYMYMYIYIVGAAPVLRGGPCSGGALGACPVRTPTPPPCGWRRYRCRRAAAWRQTRLRRRSRRRYGSINKHAERSTINNQNSILGQGRFFYQPKYTFKISGEVTRQRRRIRRRYGSINKHAERSTNRRRSELHPGSGSLLILADI